MLDEDCMIKLYSTILFIYFTTIIIIFLCQTNVLGVHSLNSSLDNNVLTNFALRDSNLSFFALGPFHEWSGREEKIGCIKYEGNNCVSEDTKIIDQPVKLYKISDKYLTGFPYEKYIDLLRNGNIIKENELCPKKFQNCGKIDTLNQTLCLPENIKCPIQDLKFGVKMLNNYENIEYKYGNVVKEYISYTNRIIDNQIIGNISLGSDFPCINKEEENWEKLEIYEKNSTTCETIIKGKAFDKRYKKAGEISYLNIYKSNLPDDTFKAMLNSIIGKTLNVYISPFIGISKDCFLNSTFDYDNNKEIEKKINIIKDFDGESIVGLFILLLFFFVFFYILLALELEKERHCMEKCFILICFLGCLFIIYKLMIEFKLDMIISIYSLNNYYNCSDDFTNSLLENDKEELKSIKILFFILLGFEAISFLITLVKFFRFIKNLCYSENQERETLIETTNQRSEKLIESSIN